MFINLHDERIYLATGHQTFNPAQPTILFIHGAGMNHLAWSLHTRYFAHNGFNVIGVDLPGHGNSNGELRTSIEAMADWIGDVVQQFEIEQVSLVGHSMGSLIALEAGARTNMPAANLTLIGCAYPMTVGPPLLEAAKNNDPVAIDMMVIWGHAYQQQIGGNPIPGVRVLNLTKRWLENNAPGVLYNDLAACNDYLGAETAMNKINVPVTMLAGDQDRMTPPKVAAGIAKDRTNVAFWQIANCGHGCMAEQPEATHRHLVDSVTL